MDCEIKWNIENRTKNSKTHKSIAQSCKTEVKLWKKPKKIDTKIQNPRCKDQKKNAYILHVFMNTPNRDPSPIPKSNETGK